MKTIMTGALVTWRIDRQPILHHRPLSPPLFTPSLPQPSLLRTPLSHHACSLKSCVPRESSPCSTPGSCPRRFRNNPHEHMTVMQVQLHFAPSKSKIGPKKMRRCVGFHRLFGEFKWIARERRRGGICFDRIGVFDLRFGENMYNGGVIACCPDR
ncbi:hypothetical protein CC80DRAFT_71256 [Byssothecium circinans]|uniref:Uncharacterized protein n=1 Tax=Byssothecium circinans TaxID=147558 RepID=A0A6A5TV75_9PLEO|nr:hypothetical protein CC80DRAFT_71256 [Byssothecium circinans]